MLIMEPYKTLIRQGTQKDAPQILKLFNKVIPQHKRDIEFWEWINTIGISDSLISVAEYQNQIIGHYCIIPKLLKCNNQEFKVGMGIHAIIDKEYRNKISIIDITKHSHQLAIDNGIVMLYGFPNENYHLIQEKIERWDVVSRYKALVFNKNVNDTQSSNLTLKSFEPIVFKDFKALLSNINPKTYNIELKNSLFYFYKRYFKHPHSIYKPYWVYKNTTIVGFVILKVFNDNLGHIIDYYVNSNIDLNDLLHSSLIKLKTEKIALWETNSDFKNAIITTQFNIKEGFKTNFLIKFLDKEFEHEYKQTLLNINKWHLPMGTSDAF